MKRINWKTAKLITVILLVVCVIMCLVFKDGSANSIFATIGGIALVAWLISAIMAKRGKLLEKKDKNFTCKTCNKKFIWDESKIECSCISVETAISGGSTFYHYKVAVRWICECGAQNEFTVVLSSRNQKYISMLQLVYKYYIGEILN